MTVAGSIFLIAVGAILRYATNWHVAHIDLDTVGLILMIAGVSGLVFGLIQQRMWSRRVDRAVTVEDRERPPPPSY